MSKRRRRSRKSRSKQGLVSLRVRGRKYFQQGDYNQAVETWARAHRLAPESLPDAWLAEAYFRRGLERLYGPTPQPESGLSDLRQALALRPEDVCTQYHVGLALQQNGDLPEAITWYKKVRRQPGTFARRAAYPLALAYIQLGTDPGMQPVWQDLTEDERGMLRNAGTFHRRPYVLDAQAPALWRALAALDSGEEETAHRILTGILAGEAPPEDTAVAHYYLGVLAARNDDLDTARKHWTTAHAQGYTSEHLAANLGESYHRLAEDYLEKGDPDSALAAASEAVRHTPDDKRLASTLAQAHQQLGYHAASAGQWERAFDHWEQARALEGGSFRLAYNLALAHEKAEDFITAGETWREALRRRPRKADHPDAITDEQVSLLWKRAAEAYVKGGEYEEAINVYKQAVKWNPDSLETRMALVDGLVNDGRLWAAENELGRILEKDENYIPALLRMGEVLSESGSWWYERQAVTYWEKVLQLEPGNTMARQSLYEYYIDLGYGSWDWSNYEDAIQHFNQALNYRPNDGHALALIGGCYLWLEQESSAHEFLEKALQVGEQDLTVYETVIHTWIDAHDNERAFEVLRQAEASVQDIPVQFYTAQAIYAMEVDETYGPVWIDHAIEVSPPDSNPLSTIGQILSLTPFIDVAEDLLLRALERGEDAGRTTTTLAMLSIRRGNSQAARRYLRDAEKIARKTRDPELRQQIDILRDLINVPPELMGLMFSNLGNSMLGGGAFPDFLDDDDEEWDDDDEFFDLFGY